MNQVILLFLRGKNPSMFGLDLIICSRALVPSRRCLPLSMGYNSLNHSFYQELSLFRTTIPKIWWIYSHFDFNLKYRDHKTNYAIVGNSTLLFKCLSLPKRFIPSKFHSEISFKNYQPEIKMLMANCQPTHPSAFTGKIAENNFVTTLLKTVVWCFSAIKTILLVKGKSNVNNMSRSGGISAFVS